jgi:hypothetical protein
VNRHKHAKQSPRAPHGIGDPSKATGFSSRPRGEEEAEQHRVPGSGASADTDERRPRPDADGH